MLATNPLPLLQAAPVFGLSSQVEQVLGRAHMLLVHFPIALLLAATLFELGGRLRRRSVPSPSATACLGLGVLGALAAGASGWLYAAHDDPGRSVEDTLFLHRWLGVATAATASLAWLMASSARRSATPGALRGYRILLFASALLVGVGGHLGGELVHGEGFLLAPLSSAADELPAQDAAGVTTAADDALAGTAAGDSSPPVPSGTAGSDAVSSGRVNYERDVQPIFADRCVECHGPLKRKGRLRLDDLQLAFAGDPVRWIVQPGDPGRSELFRRITLPADDLDIMPAKGAPLTATRIETLRRWIEQGAPWPGRPEGSSREGTPLSAGERPLPGVFAPSSDPVLSAQQQAQRAREDEALARLNERGALAERVAADSSDVEVDFGLLGQDVTDADLQLLAGLEQCLVSLSLRRTAVTDAGLAALQPYSRLQRLHLGQTTVTDAGLPQLGALVRLQSLNLFGTPVSDQGLRSLTGLMELRTLYLWGTAVTPAGVTLLREDLPQLHIEGAADSENTSANAALDEG